LDERVDFDQDKNKTTHLPSALRFYVEMQCQSNLFGCYWHNMIIQPNVGSTGRPNVMINWFVCFWKSFVWFFFYLKF